LIASAFFLLPSKYSEHFPVVAVALFTRQPVDTTFIWISFFCSQPLEIPPLSEVFFFFSPSLDLYFCWFSSSWCFILLRFFFSFFPPFGLPRCLPYFFCYGEFWANVMPGIGVFNPRVRRRFAASPCPIHYVSVTFFFSAFHFNPLPPPPVTFSHVLLVKSF